MHETYRAIHRHPLFRELERKRGRFSWLLTFLVLIAYFSFILTVAFAPQWLAAPIAAGSRISRGMPAGLLLIVLSFVLTGIYVYRANTTFDPMIKRILDSAASKDSGVGG